MRDHRRRLLFTNCTVWTGEIGSAARREVLVEGTTIAAVAPRIHEQRRRGAVMIDCADATLIPGLVDGHSHLSFLEKPNIVEIGFVPVEEHTLETMHNAYRVLLTRARQGMVICVPSGEPSDPTRQSPYYDSTFQYLSEIGIPTLA